MRNSLWFSLSMKLDNEANVLHFHVLWIQLAAYLAPSPISSQGFLRFAFLSSSYLINNYFSSYQE